MCRDPRDPNLVELERGAVGVVGNDWNSRLDKFFIENLGKFRKYDGKSVQDLLRALRNKVSEDQSCFYISTSSCFFFHSFSMHDLFLFLTLSILRYRMHNRNDEPN